MFSSSTSLSQINNEQQQRQRRHCTEQQELNQLSKYHKHKSFLNNSRQHMTNDQKKAAIDHRTHHYDDNEVRNDNNNNDKNINNNNDFDQQNISPTRLKTMSMKKYSYIKIQQQNSNDESNQNDRYYQGGLSQPGSRASYCQNNISSQKSKHNQNYRKAMQRHSYHPYHRHHHLRHPHISQQQHDHSRRHRYPIKQYLRGEREQGNVRKYCKFRKASISSDSAANSTKKHNTSKQKQRLYTCHKQSRHQQPLIPENFINIRQNYYKTHLREKQEKDRDSFYNNPNNDQYQLINSYNYNKKDGRDTAADGHKLNLRNYEHFIKSKTAEIAKGNNKKDLSIYDDDNSQYWHLKHQQYYDYLNDDRNKNTSFQTLDFVSKELIEQNKLLKIELIRINNTVLELQMRLKGKNDQISMLLMSSSSKTNLRKSFQYSNSNFITTAAQKQSQLRNIENTIGGLPQYKLIENNRIVKKLSSIVSQVQNYFASVKPHFNNFQSLDHFLDCLPQMLINNNSEKDKVSNNFLKRLHQMYSQFNSCNQYIHNNSQFLQLQLIQYKNQLSNMWNWIKRLGKQYQRLKLLAKKP